MEYKPISQEDLVEIDSDVIDSLVTGFIRLVLAFIGPDKTRALVDRETARSANALAEEIEKERF